MSLRKVCSYVVISVMLLLCQACNEENSVYRDYKCYFVFDMSLHPAPCHLTSAMGNTGHFLIVKAKLASGIRHIVTTRNYDHAEETVKLSAVIENQTRCLLGANNAIIIGRSSYTGLIMAYEGQCANCLSDYGGTSYPLTWSDNGQQLYCSHCKRSYDVNNGTVASGDPGRQLYTYNAAFDGTLLRAWN